MKSFLKFIFVFAVILLLSALLAPLLFKILPYKFERIFNRLVMIFSLVAVVVAVKRGFFRFPAHAMKPGKEKFAMLGASFVVGFFILVSMSIIKLVMGVVDLSFSDKSAGQWANLLFMSLLSAFIIGVIEEWFFRGFIFTALKEQRRMPLLGALVVTNVFYALIHFIGGRKPFIDQTPDFFDGLKLIYTPLLSLTQWESILPGAIGLFIFGVILSLLFLQTRSLYPCIGLHAGCVFFLKLDGSFFFQHARNPLILGTSHNYDGIMGWIFLILMGAILIRIMTRFGYRLAPAFALIAALLLTVPLSAQAKSSSWDVFFESEENKDKAEPGNEDIEVKNVLSPLSPASENEENFSRILTFQEKAPAPVSFSPDLAASENRGSSFSTPDAGIADFFQGGGESIQGNAEMPDKRETSTPVKETEGFSTLEDPQKILSEAEAPARTSFEQTKSAPESEGEDLYLKASPPALAAETSSRIQKEVSPNSAEPLNIQQALEEAGGAPMPSKKAIQAQSPVSASEAIMGPKVRKSDSQSLEPGEDYVFADFLQDADAFEVRESSPPIKGVWNKGGFVFPGNEENSILRVTSPNTEASGKHILFSGVPGATHRLIFPEVQANSVLELSYNVPKPAGGTKETAGSVYLKVWVGRYPLKRIHLTASGAWVREKIDMGVVQFLKDPVPVIFDVTISGPETISVGLDARIEHPA